MSRYPEPTGSRFALPRCGMDSPLHPDPVTAQFLNGKLLPRNVVLDLLTRAKHLLTAEPNLCTTTTKGRQRFNCVGDLHGQFYDLQGGVFASCGVPSSRNGYVFNGDFVDRGSWGVEVLLTLLAWKLHLPNDVYLTRGNHESRAMTGRYGFRHECESKYDPDIYELCLQVFNCLPLGLVLDGATLVVHGGLCSAPHVTLEDMNAVDRFREPPHEKGDVMMEMLWSDPTNQPGIHPGKRGGNTILFGPDVTSRFCKDNDLRRVIRSHQVEELGLSSHHQTRLLTVFSAPNYVDRGGNLGAVITFEGEKMGYVQFKHSPHPDIPPMHYMRRSRL